MYSYFSDVCNVLSNSTVNNVTVLYIIIKKKMVKSRTMEARIITIKKVCRAV